MSTQVISKENVIEKCKQDGEYICYAASLRIFLDTKNVHYSQRDIVTMVHGKFVDEGATVEQIIEVLNSLLNAQYFYYPIRIHKKCKSQQWLIKSFQEE